MKNQTYKFEMGQTVYFLGAGTIMSGKVVGRDRIKAHKAEVL